MSEEKTKYEVAGKESCGLQAQPGPFAIAIAQGVSPEQIEKFWKLQLSYEANEARKAYTAAMAAFKANPPRIVKDRHVEFKTQKGVTSYDHASIGNVVSAISAGLGEHGLSAGWDIDQSGKSVKVKCTLTHKDGHSESVSLEAPPDTSGTKNMIQAVCSTVTYLERYSLLAITGLATHDIDNDGMDYGDPNQDIQEPKLNSSDWIERLDKEDIQDVKRLEKWYRSNKAEIGKMDEVEVTKVNRYVGQVKDILIGKQAIESAPEQVECPHIPGSMMPKSDCDACDEKDDCPAHNKEENKK